MNKPQQLAVETVEGRVLVLAGAGCGKTRVLTHRMAHLIGNLGVSPQSILGLTFTNKAAVEMRHRMSGLLDEKLAGEVTLATFHSFCLQVLRGDIERLGYTSRFTLYNEKDVNRLMNYITRDILTHHGDLPSFSKAEALIQKAKNQGKRPHELVDESSKWHEHFARTLYSRLDDAMRAHNAVDFDRLLSLTVDLFENHPDLLASYQERYRYIMVDEYQDTNPVQYRLAALLSGKYNNLCVVGDDDQSIYGWRGAEVRNILEFDNAKVITLEQNYRSTNTILRAANAIIQKNTERREKVLWSECGEGELLEVFVAENEGREAEAVVKRILRLREKENLKWRDIAILYRSNALSRKFEVALTKQAWKGSHGWNLGIPYKIHGSTELYERREVKDLQAYLRVIVDPLDQEALLRIINQPRRGVGESSLNALTGHNRTHNLPLWDVIREVLKDDDSTGIIQETLSPQAREGLKDFVKIIDEASFRFSTQSLATTFEWLIERIVYKRAIKEEVKSVQMRDFKWQNVLEFANILSAFEQQQLVTGRSGDSFSQLVDFVGNFPLGNYSAGSGDENDPAEDKVQLMTFHSAKGLEFPACFLVGIEDHIIPHEKSIIENGVDEERRLMYVAVTRAMKHLTLSMSAKRLRMGKEEVVRPSRFLFDIPQELLHKTEP